MSNIVVFHRENQVGSDSYKKNERLSCGQKSGCFAMEKYQKIHQENQNKVQYLDFAFLALPVTHLRSNPYRTPIPACMVTVTARFMKFTVSNPLNLSA